MLFRSYLVMDKKYLRSLIFLVLSIGTKFATVFMIPIFLLFYFFDKSKRKLNWEKLFALTLLLMIVPAVLASIRTSYQPWYLLYVLPFAALVARRYYVFIPSIILSLMSLFQYLPFLYLGNWDKPVPSILFWMTIGSIFFSIFLVLVWVFRITVYKNAIK